MNPLRRWPARRWLPIVAAASLLDWFGLVHAAADGAAVGEVSLAIGDARVVRRDGTQQVLKQGAPVFVGDRIETSASGHVHLRFVDQGAVSVRPGSTLEVQSYRYDSARPENNEVRLRVVQGVARSISGAATEYDKTRFRLNTPLAAIGVRGTDFIVQSDSSSVRAVVAEGAISVVPFGAGCSANGLGPCAGAQERVLSASMSGTMAEVRPGDTTARLAPALAGLLPAHYLAGLGGSDAGSRSRSTTSEATARAEAIAAAQPASDTRIRNNDRTVADLLAIAPRPNYDVHEAAAVVEPNAQLVWGRWSFSSNIDPNFAARYADAAVGRHVTIGDIDAVLLRSGPKPDPNGPGPDRSLGRFDLQLTRATADFSTGTRTELASVDGGTLSLDFGARTFATALALSSAAAGKTELRVGGRIGSDGIFNARDNEQKVSGAVTLDGKESGYLFERITSGGVFRGKTLWGRGP